MYEVCLTPSHIPVQFGTDYQGWKGEKCAFSHFNFPRATISRVHGQLGHLHFCDDDYPKVHVCLCEVWMDSVQQWWNKPHTRIQAMDPLASTKSNTYFMWYLITDTETSLFSKFIDMLLYEVPLTVWIPTPHLWLFYELHQNGGIHLARPPVHGQAPVESCSHQLHMIWSCGL